MQNALKAMPEVFAEFKKHFGVGYDFIDTYKLDDADVAIVVLSSTAGTTKVVVDELRTQGKKVGLLRPRVFRPFPKEKIVQALSKLKAVAILDRSDSFSSQGGPLFSEIRSALLDQTQRPLSCNYIYGLGGRDIGPEQIKSVYADLEKITKEKKVKNLVNYLGVR
jgi:pyruvate ferredoxin oxidoreductase alpha subunit